MRHPVGPPVQLAIAQLARFIYHRHGLRRALRLRFKQLVHALVTRILHPARVPLHQHTLPFPLRQHLQAAQRPARRLFQRFDKPLQRRVHQLAYPLRLDRRLHLRGERKTLAPIVHRKRTGVVGALFRIKQLHALHCLQGLAA